MPSERQDTALVTVAGGRGAPTSNLWPCWVMYLKNAKIRQLFLKIGHLPTTTNFNNYNNAYPLEAKLF